MGMKDEGNRLSKRCKGVTRPEKGERGERRRFTTGPVEKKYFENPVSGRGS